MADVVEDLVPEPGAKQEWTRSWLRRSAIPIPEQGLFNSRKLPPACRTPTRAAACWRGTGGDVQVQFDRPSSLTAARKTVGSAAAAGTMACRAHAGRVACTRAWVIAAYRQLAWRQARS